MPAVLGAGAMGAALAIQLARAGRPVSLCATEYDGAALDAMQAGKEHPALGVAVPDGVALVDHQSWAEALSKADVVVLAVSTSGLDGTVAEAAPHAGNVVWAVATKGWEEATLRSASAVVAEELGDPKRVVALVGPSLAGEIALGVPTAVVAAGVDPAATNAVAALFSSPLFRTYTSDDVSGVEVGAALKNVVAIAIGLCDGLAEQYGVPALTNTKAFLFSRGLVEMARLARALGGRSETVLGLAGAGDLFVTALGGRNARFGRLVGSGVAPAEAVEQMNTTVEGYMNARAALALGERYSLDVPVVRATCGVLYDGVNPKEAIESLVGGQVEEEFNP